MWAPLIVLAGAGIVGLWDAIREQPAPRPVAVFPQRRFAQSIPKPKIWFKKGDLNEADYLDDDDDFGEDDDDLLDAAVEAAVAKALLEREQAEAEAEPKISRREAKWNKIVGKLQSSIKARGGNVYDVEYTPAWWEFERRRRQYRD